MSKLFPIVLFVFYVIQCLKESHGNFFSGC